MTSSHNSQLHPFNVAFVPAQDTAGRDSAPAANADSPTTETAPTAHTAEPSHATHEQHATPTIWQAPTAQDQALPPIPEPTPEQRQAIELVSRLSLVAQETKAALNERLAEFDLNDIRYSVLSIVREAAAEGCSQSMLAQKLRQSESSISTLVDRMRTSGLLYRLRSKTDRRKRFLTLTERGRELLAAADARYGNCVDDILGSLSSEDRTILATLLQRLLLRIDGHTTESHVHTPAA